MAAQFKRLCLQCDHSHEKTVDTSHAEHEVAHTRVAQAPVQAEAMQDTSDLFVQYGYAERGQEYRRNMRL